MSKEKLKKLFDQVVAAESTAITRIIRDAKDGIAHKKSQFRSWKSGEAGINPINYGILQAWIPAMRRMPDDTLRQEAAEWTVKHIHDTVAIFWQSMGTSGKPPGEGGWINPATSQYENWDSDILRHVDVAGFCDAAKEPLLINAGLDVSLIHGMAVRWAEWLHDPKWLRKKRETLRMGLPLNSLVAIYELTGDKKWLYDAMWLFHFGWGSDVERVSEDGSTWDSGYPWEERGGYMAHITDWPWYEGNMAQAFMRLWRHGDQGLKDLIVDRIMKISEKYTHPLECKPIGSSSIHNTPLHGGQPGDNGDSWVRAHQSLLTPSGWLELPDDIPYHQKRCLEWRPIDGDYESPYFYDSDGNPIARRDHHQDNGPSLARDSAHATTLLFARYLATRKEEDYLHAFWVMWDYKMFANHSGHIAKPKEKWSKDWYGDAAGKNRLLAWRFLSGWPMMLEFNS